ncbi:polysaccharide biosynthesis C-terminal domain-containing protein [Clostridiisalibacter paucivorans]|uniref:polysaccharide biosynthesis C-terminal domain-containing protein n=1 Tax=Clostridiisalibacter paucivorans TaxID=408753 RepID=UPI00047B5C0B
MIYTKTRSLRKKFYDNLLDKHRYMLVPQFGMYGAAFAFLIAKLVIVVIVIALSKHYDNIGYSVLDMLKVIIPSWFFMSMGLVLSYSFFMYKFSWVNLFYKIFVLLIYLVYLYFKNRDLISRLKRLDDVKKIKNFLKWKREVI